MWKQEDMTWEVKIIWRCAKQEYMTLCELKRIWSLVKTRGHDVRSQKDMTLCKPRVYDVVWNQEDTEFWENKRIWREKSKGYDVRNGKDMTLWKTRVYVWCYVNSRGYNVLWKQEDMTWEVKMIWCCAKQEYMYDVVWIQETMKLCLNTFRSDFVCTGNFGGFIVKGYFL